MKSLQLNVRPFSMTAVIYEVSAGALWLCPTFALAFMWINTVLAFLGIVNTSYLMYTVALPVALTAVALLVNLAIEFKHLPPDFRKRGFEDSENS